LYWGELTSGAALLLSINSILDLPPRANDTALDQGR